MNDLEKRKAYLCEECDKSFLKHQLRTLWYVISGAGGVSWILCRKCGMDKIRKITENEYLVKFRWNC